MPKKARLGLYLKDEQTANQIKIAAARRKLSVSRYCAQAIEERLIKDGEKVIGQEQMSEEKREKLAFLAKVDRLRKKIGPIGIASSELVKAGRRR